MEAYNGGFKKRGGGYLFYVKYWEERGRGVQRNMNILFLDTFVINLVN